MTFMKLIPDTVLNFKSNAEAKIFRKLESIDIGPLWTAYHSLNLSEHNYKNMVRDRFFAGWPSRNLCI